MRWRFAATATVVVAAVACWGLDAGAAAAAAPAAVAPNVLGGVWGTAQPVPGLAALNQGGFAGITSVSCASAGNCSAGGSYESSPDFAQAFVVSETNGTWGTALEVPGTAAFNQGDAGVSAVSCGSPGNCSAGGAYLHSGGFQVYVVNQVNGTWHTAKEVPGTAALNQGGDALISSVSCASAGSCSAGRYYSDSSGHQQAFVVPKVKAHGAAQ